MIESAFLDAVGAFLTGAGLTPAPASVGIAEPGAAGDLPAVVLSLEAAERPGKGLGQRSSLITDGALEWQAQIDLANPVLSTDPAFSLLSGDRLRLTLPHGGLVRHDGTRGPLAAADLAVTVAGGARTLVAGPPVGNEFSVDPEVGQLTFGTALPAAGLVEATYVLGQWEQKLARLAGVLRVDVCAADATGAAALSRAVVAGLTAPDAAEAVRRILSLSVTELSSVGVPERLPGPGAAGPTFRRRTARLRFLFEQVIDEPESSGGIITRVPVTSRTDATGPDSTEVMTVTG